MPNASASNSISPSGIALVGGAVAIAILRILIKRKILSIADVRGVLKTAQRSLACSPALTGSIDGARIIAEVTEQFTGR